ncbi:alpha/beta fold hydrolase [Actinoallomurus iriomotensis]|uniref:Alpha/beta hydrolase n=1 Tax=Actinoallomurus iriomotensis TaxID=478107 RepID=A0A9W6RHK5_9ACTN|nr:alpha/beta fold hydrolase [Actinoallomurus iriomotensis]GLY76201.1 alpha/beta hydrolase [Actinoallomurus iriomotensis]
MGTFTNGQIAIAYDDHNPEGAEPPLVLVHGHPFDRSMWAPQVRHVARDGRRVIVPDLRGYGRSGVVPGKTPLRTFAQDIAGLLDHLGVAEIVLGGLSMGGQIVMEFHRLFPDRLRGLVLADTTPQAETDEGRRVRDAMADRLLREGMGGYADEVLAKMVAPASIRRFPAVAEHVLAMMRATSPDGAAAALRGRAERPDYVASLARVRVPTLIVVGGDDEFTPIGDARLMHRIIPGSTLAVIEGAAHMPNLERPAEFNEALGKFLASITGMG